MSLWLNDHIKKQKWRNHLKVKVTIFLLSDCFVLLKRANWTNWIPQKKKKYSECLDLTSNSPRKQKIGHRLTLSAFVQRHIYFNIIYSSESVFWFCFFTIFSLKNNSVVVIFLLKKVQGTSIAAMFEFMISTYKR